MNHDDLLVPTVLYCCLVFLYRSMHIYPMLNTTSYKVWSVFSNWFKTPVVFRRQHGALALPFLERQAIVMFKRYFTDGVKVFYLIFLNVY